MLICRYFIPLLSFLLLVHHSSAQGEKTLSFYTSPTYNAIGSAIKTYEINLGSRVQWPIMENVYFISGLIYTYQYDQFLDNGALNRHIEDLARTPEIVPFWWRSDDWIQHYSFDTWSHQFNIPLLIKTNLWPQEQKVNFYATTGFRVGYNIYTKDFRKGFQPFNYDSNELEIITSEEVRKFDGLPHFLSSYGALGCSYALSEKIKLNLEPYVTYFLLRKNWEINHPVNYGLGIEVTHRI